MEPVRLSMPHWEALTDATRQAYHLLADLPFIQRFYLAGGTSLTVALVRTWWIFRRFGRGGRWGGGRAGLFTGGSCPKRLGGWVRPGRR